METTGRHTKFVSGLEIGKSWWPTVVSNALRLDEVTQGVWVAKEEG